MFIKVLFISILSFYPNKGAVLLWSNNKLEVSPLNIFNNDNLEELVQTLGYPEVAIYKSTSQLLPKFEELLDGYHTAYNPNGDISSENATDIIDSDDLTLLEARQRLEMSIGSNVLYVLIHPNERIKREAANTPETTSKPYVLYRGKTSQNLYSLLYSSQAIILRTINNTVNLGDAISVTTDFKQSKSTSLRLVSTIPVAEEKYILQFIFSWQNTYWSVASVKVKSTMSDYSANLVASEPFSVPAHFSYHCSGVNVFSDANKTSELLIYDLQIQPDSRDGTFGDVYDCVDFTTVPIWSGLLVTGLLGIGLLVALLAISEIKTMDKFDNQKTKQLSITVSE